MKTKVLFNNIFYDNINLKSTYIKISDEFRDKDINIKINYQNIEKILKLIEYITKKSHSIKPDNTRSRLCMMPTQNFRNIAKKNKWFNLGQYVFLFEIMTNSDLIKLSDDDIIHAIEFSKYYGLKRAELFLTVYFSWYIFPKKNMKEIIEIFYNPNTPHKVDLSDIEWMKKIDY